MKPLMRKSRHCYSHPQTSGRLTPSLFKYKNWQRRRRTPEKISPLTSSLLTRLVGHSHLLLSRLPPPTQKRTKTTAETLSMDRDEVKTYLQWVSTSLQRKKKETFPKSIASIIEKRAIMPISVLKRGNKSQKTSNNLGDLYANDHS